MLSLLHLKIIISNQNVSRGNSSKTSFGPIEKIKPIFHWITDTNNPRINKAE